MRYCVEQYNTRTAVDERDGERGEKKKKTATKDDCAGCAASKGNKKRQCAGKQATNIDISQGL